MLKNAIFLLGFALASAVTQAAPSGPAAAPSQAGGPTAPHFISGLFTDADIQRMIDDRVVTYRDSVGIIVGIVDPSGRKLFARGPARVGDDESVNGDTIFPVGGITKIFAALLLADMARRGQVALDDPVAKYLPAGTRMPQRGDRPITLLDLATHTSGLPRMPANVAVTDFNNPNAAMSADQLLKSVQAYELTREAGDAYEYSDAGFDLLALAEEKAGGTDFDTLLKSRILAPLKMADTRVTASYEERDRLASGYDEHLRQMPRRPTPVLIGAEGMRSTASNLLTFLAANLGLVNTPLAGAMADMTKTRRATDYDALKAALGWHIATLNSVEIVWEDGQVDGFRAFIGFAPKSRTGVVVLSNSDNTINDIGVHILDPDVALGRLRREVVISPGAFANYVGRYQVSETFSVVVTEDRGRLYIQGMGQPRAELFFAGDDRFFLRVVDGEVSFQTDGSGRAQTLSLTQDGKTVGGQRVQ